MISNLPKSLIDAATKVITESNEPRLKHIAEVKTNFPDADYYIVRKGSRDTVGKVTNEFSPEHIGVKITHKGVLPKYHQYAMQYAHMNGYWKPKAKGVLELQHINVDDVKNMPAIYRGLNESNGSVGDQSKHATLLSQWIADGSKWREDPDDKTFHPESAVDAMHRRIQEYAGNYPEYDVSGKDYELRNVNLNDIEVKHQPKVDEESAAITSQEIHGAKSHTDLHRKHDVMPILLGHDMSVLDGHHRLHAAKLNSESTIPALVPVGKGSGKVLNAEQFIASNKRLEESTEKTHIDVDGELKHRYNSEGKLIHHTDDGIRNFHKWFKNSSFTDEQGRPRVMYHGAKSRITMKMDGDGSPTKTPDGEFDIDYHGSDIHRFHASSNGKLGSGVYLTSDRKEAENYTEGKGTIYPVYANGEPIRKEHTLGITNWTVHPHQIKSALGNSGKFSHVFNIHEEVEPENKRPSTIDEHGKHIVFDNNTYKISVNNPDDATYIALWHQGKKVGAMFTGSGRTSDTNGYSTVRSVDIDKKHQGQGMGKQMYRVALQYAHEKYKGIGSEQPDRVNKKQVPSILKRLGGTEHESGDVTIDR